MSGVPSLNLLLILQCDSRPKEVKWCRQGRQIYLCHSCPKSDWVGSEVGLASGKAAHSPAPARAPNNTASPSPSPLSGGLLGSHR